MDSVRFETKESLVMLHIGRKEALTRLVNSLPRNQGKPTRHIFLIEETSFAEHLSLYNLVSREAREQHDISVIPAPDEHMIQFFIDNLKRTLQDVHLTRAKETELEEEVSHMHSKQIAEEYMEYEFGWTRRKAGRFIAEHDIRNLRELIDRPELVGNFEKEKLRKLARLCREVRSNSVRRSSSRR